MVKISLYPFAYRLDREFYIKTGGRENESNKVYC